MKNYLYKLSFVFISFLLIFISSEGNAMEDNAFSFKFESIEGNPMPLSDYEGKALLVVKIFVPSFIPLTLKCTIRLLKISFIIVVE